MKLWLVVVCEFSGAYAAEMTPAEYLIPRDAMVQSKTQTDIAVVTCQVVNTEDSGTAGRQGGTVDTQGRDIQTASGMYPHLVDKQHHSVHKPAGKETADQTHSMVEVQGTAELRPANKLNLG